MKRFASVIVFMLFVVAVFAQVPDELKPTVKEGSVFFKAKEYDKAILKFQEAQKAAPDNQTIIYYIAISAYKAKQFDLALQSSKSNLENGYKPEKSYQYITDILKKQEKYEEMREYIEKGLKQYPANKELIRLGPICYVQLGLLKYNEALALQKELAPISQTDPDKYKEEIKKATAIFNEALEITLKGYEIDKKRKNVLQALVGIYTALEDDANAKRIEGELEGK